MRETEKQKTQPSTLIRQNGKTLAYMAITIALPLSVSSFVSYLALEHHNELVQWTSFSLAGVSLVCALAMGLALVPTTFVALLNGYLFGWKAFPLVVLAYFFASIIGYALGKKLGYERTKKWFTSNEKLALVAHHIQHREALIIVLGRLSPILPFAMMNLFFASIGVSFKRFLWAGTLGMLPRTLLFIWVGTQASSLQLLIDQGERPALTHYISLVLVIVTTVALSLVGKKIWQSVQAQTKV